MLRKSTSFYNKYIKKSNHNATKPLIQNKSFGSLTIHSTNKLILTFPESTVDYIRQTILTIWSKGIQNENRTTSTVYKIKLYGQPWGNSGNDSIKGKVLYLSIIQSLLNFGWQAILSTNLFSENQPNQLIFEQIKKPELTQPMFSIHFDQGDRLRVVDGPPDVIPLIRQALSVGFPNGIQSESYDNSSCYEFKLYGYPWYSVIEEQESINGRIWLLSLLSTLKDHRWNVYVNVNLSQNDKECHTWIFRGSPEFSPYFQTNFMFA